MMGLDIPYRNDTNNSLNVTDILLFANHGKHSVLDRLYNGFCLVTGTVGLITNLLVFTIILKGITKKQASKGYSLCMAIGNVVYSISAVLSFCIGSEILTIQQSVCSVFIFINNFGYYTCASSLLLVAVERICAIRFPLFFRQIAKQKHVTFLITLVLLSSLALTIFPLTDSKVVAVKTNNASVNHCEQTSQNKNKFYYLVLNFLLPVVLFISLTIWAIIVLKNRSTSSVVGEGTRPRGNGASLRRSQRYLTFIVIMFILCYVPFGIYGIINICTDGEIGTQALYLVRWLTYSHTWVNPLMYWICDPTVKKKVYKIICGCRNSKKTKSSQTQATTNNTISGNVHIKTTNNCEM